MTSLMYAEYELHSNYPADYASFMKGHAVYTVWNITY